FAVFELNNVFAAGVLFGDASPCAVIEDVAVLQDFDKGGAFVRGGLLERVFQVSLKDIDGASDESSFGANRQRDRIEWTIERSERSGFSFFAKFGCRRILAFCQTVDAVV